MKFTFRKSHVRLLGVIGSSLLLILGFQNCSNKGINTISLNSQNLMGTENFPSLTTVEPEPGTISRDLAIQVVNSNQINVVASETPFTGVNMAGYTKAMNDVLEVFDANCNNKISEVTISYAAGVIFQFQHTLSNQYVAFKIRNGNDKTACSENVGVTVGGSYTAPAVSIAKNSSLITKFETEANADMKVCWSVKGADGKLVTISSSELKVYQADCTTELGAAGVSNTPGEEACVTFNSTLSSYVKFKASSVLTDNSVVQSSCSAAYFTPSIDTGGGSGNGDGGGGGDNGGGG